MSHNDPLTLLSFPQTSIALLTLNRPQARNALNLELLQELITSVEELSANPKVRVLVLHGAGEVFCAGLDLKEAQDESLAEKSGKAVANALQVLYGSPLVTIAAVHGAAIAGGGGIMAACDMVIAAEDAKIGFPETRRGLVAALLLALLQRQIADRHLRELLFTGELISSERAERIGLVNRVVSMHNVLEEALELAAQVLKGAPNATVISKELLNAATGEPISKALDNALSLHMYARHSQEALEGIYAFSDKREPNWPSARTLDPLKK